MSSKIITAITLAALLALGFSQDENSSTSSERPSYPTSENIEISTSSPLPPTPALPMPRARLEGQECKEVPSCSGSGGRPLDPSRVLNISFLTTCGSDKTRNFLGHKIVGALSLAVDAVNKRRLLPDNYSLVYEVHNTGSEVLRSVGQVCRDSLSNVNVFIGPEQKCKTEALIAAAAEKPLLSYACQDVNSSQSDSNTTTQKYDHGFFVKFNPGETTVLHNVMHLFLQQKWFRFLIVYTRDMKDKAEQLFEMAKSPRYSLKPFPMREVSGMLKINEMLRATKYTTRIYVLLGHRGEVSNFLVAMSLQGMLGDPQRYLVVFFEFEEHHAKDWLTYIWGQSLPSDLSQRQRRRLLLKYSRALLLVRGAYPYTDFSRMRNRIICRNIKRPFCLQYSRPSKLVVPHQTSAYLYDAVVEYAKAVRRLHDMWGGRMSVPQVAARGREIVAVMRNYTYTSSLGYEVTLDSNAESEGNYSAYLFYNCNNCTRLSPNTRRRLLQSVLLNRTAPFQCPAPGADDDEEEDDFHSREGKNLPSTPCLASFRGERVNFADFADERESSCFVEVVKFKSARVFSNLSAIDDEPECGLSGDECGSFEDVLLVILYCFAGVFVLLVWGLLMQHIILKAQRKITGLRWKISPCDIDDFCSRPRGSTRSLGQLNSSGDFYYARVGAYQGTTVCQKPVFLVDSKVRFSRELMKDIHRIRSIKHRNVCKFYGVCVKQQTILLISEYQTRGSLRDVLKNECTAPDEAFIESLMMDLIKGMCFLHDQYGPHGHLRTSNCVVSGRWVLQVTDYGLTELRAHQRRDGHSFKCLFNKLYWAPELLRRGDTVAGSKEGDVYAFGIILHETLNRRGPFGLCEDDFDRNYEAALNKILDEISREPRTGDPLKRPSLAEIVEKPFGTNIQMIDLLKKCWAEDSSQRPTFKALKNDFSKHSGEQRPLDLMDHLMSMMEKHSNNLEKLIEARTEELQREKELTDQLLYSVLPRPVAQALKHGIAVEPQSFDSVTIYFSDIVGFTALSAQSTPLQIVTFLDELYRMFDGIISGYDVYKVETIGDAYMVVSGLPEKQEDLRHAGEIASMSLELVAKTQSFKIAHRPNEPLKLRVGVHTGPVMAGVVGLAMPRYCLFGDTVNTAARFESNGLPNKIHISTECRRALEQLGGYVVEKRGWVEMKGKGQQETHWLLGATEEAVKRRPTLPTPPGHILLGEQKRHSKSHSSFDKDQASSLPRGARAVHGSVLLPERQRLLDPRHRCSSISGIAADLPVSRLRRGLNPVTSSLDKILPNSALNLASSRLDEVVESAPLIQNSTKAKERRSHPQSQLIESSV